ncbi:hypothetical protein EG240_12530 [Paenimyroides tangerinum]|uniref:DKNYY family protein n=1 Tax=Paenimyroides tangerinum TaxID=2488728 RepID=A0A3P3W2K3_9FLAO|nr:DKNYY domain-containing protein [Paenimyroides tangerinum]RRJ89190.1 hypothetical protein EG240_12530 [Paenimyroides tangerinum]
MFYKYRYIFYIIIGGPFLIGILLIIGLISNSGSEQKLQNNLVEINDVFSKNQENVYATVPHNGNYELSGVSVNDFKTLEDNNSENAHIGRNTKNVYSGNLILEDLNPNSVITIGNNYYTDGKTTYYSNRTSERNKKIGFLHQILQLTTYNFGITSKPQIYWYPFVKLEDNLKLRKLNGYALAASADKVYFEGKEMPKANPLKTRPIFNTDNSDNYRYFTDKIYKYFTDEIHIYYENQLIDLAYNTEIIAPNFEGELPYSNEYLIDSKNGNVIVDARLFPKENAPYKILSTNLKNANQVLFASKNGIYYYVATKEKIERMGENPFKNNDFNSIYGGVINSNNELYYLTISNDWSSKNGLKSRNTELNLLENVRANDLVRLDNDQNNIGSIWKAKNRYFFFDNQRDIQFYKSSIYEFVNPEDAINLLKQENIRYNDLESLKEQEKLIIPNHTNFGIAKTKAESENSSSLITISAVSLALLLVLGFVFRNKIFRPYIFEDGYLIVNSIIVSKYKISNIEEVVFNLKYDYRRFVTTFKIITKDGKINKWHGYLRTLSLINPANANIDDYLEILQKELEQKGIKSRIEVVNRPN